MTIDREELAWCAGFLDGEGHFACKGNRGIGSSMSITAAQATLRPLERLQNTLGGKVYGPYQPKGTRRQPYWQWCINNFERAQNAIAQLWVFLSEPKREQARAALLEQRRRFRYRTWGGGYKKLTEQQVAKIREWHTRGWTQARLAEKYGVHQTTIHNVVTRKTWKR